MMVQKSVLKIHQQIRLKCSTFPFIKRQIILLKINYLLIFKNLYLRRLEKNYCMNTFVVSEYNKMFLNVEFVSVLRT